MRLLSKLASCCGVPSGDEDTQNESENDSGALYVCYLVAFPDTPAAKPHKTAKGLQERRGTLDQGERQEGSHLRQGKENGGLERKGTKHRRPGAPQRHARDASRRGRRGTPCLEPPVNVGQILGHLEPQDLVILAHTGEFPLFSSHGPFYGQRLART